MGSQELETSEQLNNDDTLSILFQFLFAHSLARCHCNSYCIFSGKVFYALTSFKNLSLILYHLNMFIFLYLSYSALSIFTESVVASFPSLILDNSQPFYVLFSLSSLSSVSNIPNYAHMFCNCVIVLGDIYKYIYVLCNVVC